MNYVRVIPELRAAHLDRHSDWGADETLLFFEFKYDVTSDTRPPASVRKFSFKALLRASREMSVVEIPEPLWVRETLRTLSWAIPLKAIRGRKVRFVAYCIENNRLDHLLGFGRVGTLLAPLARVLIGLAYSTLLSRVVYGSLGAQDAYSMLTRVGSVPHRLILELPAPAGPPPGPGRSNDVLFFGRLEERKGVLDLLTAWEKIEATTSMNLTVVGDGPFAEVVRDWAESHPRRTYLPQAEHSTMPGIIQRHAILVAPSKRWGRWREQIGLPIKESLAEGLTIVTTQETGLSEWLSAHGHHVVPAGDIDALAAAMVEAQERPLDPHDVRRSLPKVDGREEAHSWLKKA